jgi:hypothetical protein
MRSAIDVLVAYDWLDAKESDDPVEVRAAIVDMVNAMLEMTPKTPEPPRFRRALKSVQSALSLGLF